MRGGDTLVVVLRLRLGLLAVEALVLPQADGPLPAPRLFRVGGAGGIAQDAEHSSLSRIENCCFRPIARRRCAAGDAERVEGADRQVLRGARADQALGALAHFLRRPCW